MTEGRPAGRRRLLLLPFLLPWLFPGLARGAGAKSTAVTVLPPVTVTGALANPATGRSTLGAGVIRDLPRGNGSLAELLLVFPDVQLEDGYNTSLNAGEILPPKVSISGGRAAQNDFQLDGAGINSLLDPDAGSADLLTDVPGHPQEVFPAADLISRVTVYDSNVPARYGGFTGGVIDARTRSPRLQAGGRLDYRTTRSAWTRFQLAPGDRYAFETSSSPVREPRFTKQDAGVEFDLPLGRDAGVLAACRLLYSEIPLRQLGGSKTQTRRLENFFLKGDDALANGDLLELSALYSPYRAQMFLAGAVNSDFTIEGGGAALSATWSRTLAAAELDGRLAWRRSRNSRHGPPDWRNWLTAGSHAWGAVIDSSGSPEGGFGTVVKTEQDLETALDWRQTGAGDGLVRQQFAAGFDLQHAAGTFSRKTTTYVYDTAELDPDILCGGDDYACAEHEQFFTHRRVYPAARVSAAIDTLAFYGQDRLHFGRLEVRPGLRVTYDDFMHNLNPAPRLALSWDLFGDGRTVLIGGLNRYYGKTLLTAKLREAKQPPQSEFRSSYQNQLQPWLPAASGQQSLTRFSDLKTPYADEAVLGLDQRLWGGRLSLKFVQRYGYDEYARRYGALQPDGLRYYTMTNAGRSRHRSYRLSWERNWVRNYFSFSATRQETTRNSESYDSLVEETVPDQVWFNGRLIYRDQLPHAGYNRPWVLSALWITHLPWGFTFTNLTTYKSAYRDISKTQEQQNVTRVDPATGVVSQEPVDVYREVRYGAMVRFDWILRWQSRFLARQGAAVTLEVDNVFNARARTSASTLTYALGRQFWLGAQYTF